MSSSSAERNDFNLGDSLEVGKQIKIAERNGSKYQPPVKDLTTFVDDILGSHHDRLRPFSPPATNLISLIDPNKTIVTKTKDKTVVMNYAPKGTEKKELHYDVILQCYVDPETNEYYAPN